MTRVDKKVISFLKTSMEYRRSLSSKPKNNFSLRALYKYSLPSSRHVSILSGWSRSWIILCRFRCSLLESVLLPTELKIWALLKGYSRPPVVNSDHNKVSDQNNEINHAQHQQRYTLPPEINAAVVHFDPADFFGALQAVGNGHNGGNEQPHEQSRDKKQNINRLGGAGICP